MEKSKKDKIIIAVITVSIIIVTLGLCLGLPTEKSYVNYDVMGNSSLQTILSVNVVNQKQVGNKILAEAEKVNKLINPTLQTSDIYKINNSSKGEVVKVDKSTINLLETAYDVYIKSGKQYNPASYYLVDIWNFSAEKYDKSKAHTVPLDSEIELGIKLAKTFEDTVFILDTDNDSEVQQKLVKGSFVVDKVHNTVCRQEKCFIGEVGAKIDLGGIAKGYAVNNCYNVFVENNAKNGLVNLGGNVYSYGRQFKVGIENPFKAVDQQEEGDNSNIFGVVGLQNNSLSCSGIYERNYKIDDKLYHHIIDTTTGRPVEIKDDSIVMACVIGKNGAVVDAVATSLVLKQTIASAEQFINSYYKDDISSVILITSNRTYKVIGDIQLEFNDKLQGFTKID